MAFVASQIPQEEQNQQGPQGTTTSNPLALLPPQATQTGGSAGQGGGTTTPSGGSPTQFGTTASRLGDYLSANQQQVQGMANQIAGNFNNQYGNIQGEINNLGQNFGQTVGGGYAAYNPNLISQEQANPTQFASNTQNVSAFQGQLNDQYTGPANVESTAPYAQVQSDISNAVQNSGVVNTYPGLSTYLQNNIAQGTYTPGQNALDTTLLQTNQPAYQTITGAANQFNNLGGQLSNAAQQADITAAAAPGQAQQAQQAAQGALQSGLTNEEQALQNEQNTIQGVVNEYNQSVNTINPVVGNITSDINAYLAANPNLNLPNATAALNPIEGLNPINMPAESTYASPQDYATLAALQTLGGNVSGAAINPANASQAQTFQLPTALQNAVGQAPGVESALTGEMNTLGGEINTAVSGYEAAQNQVNTASAQATDLQNQIQSIMSSNNIGGTGLNSLNAHSPGMTPQAWSQLQPLLAQWGQANQQVSQGYTAMQNYAPSLQWVNGASSGYNDLINQINAQLGNLGNVGVPTINYSAETVTDPVTGLPVSSINPKAANLAGTVGGATAGTAGAVGAIGNAAAAGATGAPEALDIAPSLGTTLPAAALAAYGTSNIIQNAAANPIQTGLETLGNTMSLGALSLPPNVLSSIGNDIQNVFNDIGNFFGGIF